VFSGKITLNNSKYFEIIALDLWEFRIGGCEVLERWLKSRKGRKPEYFLNIAEILLETKSIMKQIDGIPFLTNS